MIISDWNLTYFILPYLFIWSHFWLKKMRKKLIYTIILCGWYEQCCDVLYHRIATKWAITKTISPLSENNPHKNKWAILVISPTNRRYCLCFCLLRDNFVCLLPTKRRICLCNCPLSDDIISRTKLIAYMYN